MKPVKEIRDALGIEREAVGVKYTDESPAAKLADGQYAVCNGILEAAKGKVIMLSKETCACGGGKSHLGLTETSNIPLKMLVEVGTLVLPSKQIKILSMLTSVRPIFLLALILA